MGVKDLDDLISQWVSYTNDEYEEGVDIETDFHRVHMTTVNTKFPERQQQTLPESSRSPIIFKSNYDNRTREAQSHTFTIERTTEDIVQTKVTQGFSRRGGVGINIDVPENVRNLTGSFGNDISITSQDENTVKRSVTWKLNSTVTAQPGYRTTAILKVIEDEFRCSFKTQAILSGTVLVRIKDGSDEVMQGDIATIIGDLKERGLLNVKCVKIENGKLTWPMLGSLKFKFGISQDTSVSSQRL